MLFVDRCTQLTGETISKLFLISLLISCLEVALRYLFDSPTVWAYDVTIAMCAVAYIFAGSYCLQEGSHIRITSVYGLLPAGGRKTIDLISLTLGLIYAGALVKAFADKAYSAVYRFQDGMWAPETSGNTWDAPTPAIISAFVFLGCVLFLAQIISLIVARIRNP